MSRWFPEHVELRFGDAPSLASSSSHRSPAALAGQVVAGKLDAALIAFERELDALDMPRGTRLTCVLAGEGVRYRVVPWRDDLASPTQRQLLATQCFAEAYGDAARSWTIRQNTGGHGAATLACAVDSTLLDRIDAMTQARGLRLVSVQPSLMHAFNRVRGRIEADLFWFVCIEGPWTTLLLTARDEPRHVKVLPGANGSGDLSRLLDREWFALGVETPRCPVVVSRLVEGSDASTGLTPTLVKGWQVIDLDAAVERRAFVHPASSVAASGVVASPAATSVATSVARPAAAAAAAPSVVTAAVIPVETQAAPTTSAPWSMPPPSPPLVSQPATLPASMSVSIHATMPAPLIAKPFIPTAGEPSGQRAPVATSVAMPIATSASTPAVIEPVPVHVPEPEPLSVAIPQFEWWSAPAAAPPAAALPAAPAPAPAAAVPAVTPPLPAARHAPVPARPAQLPVPPVPLLPEAPQRAARPTAAPVAASGALPAAPFAAPRAASRRSAVPAIPAMERHAGRDLTARAAMAPAADFVESSADDEPAPGKWTSLFRRRPKAASTPRPSAPSDDDLPVPRWVNGRWESS